jgi:hypothetical protein
MFTLRKGHVGMLAAGSMIIAGVGATGASAAGTPSPESMVVRDGGHWYTQSYENTPDGLYTDPEQSDVTGPQRAPFGSGSHKMAIGQYSVQTELYRTNDYDGVNLGDLTRLEYSTFERNTAGGEDRQPAYLRLSVDTDGDLTTIEDSLFFFPGNNGTVVNGEWQNWDVTGGLMNIGGDPSGTGEISLADYAAANPTATLVNVPYDDSHDAGAISLIAGAANTQTRGEYFVDRVIVGSGGQDTLFDFGPSGGANDGTTQVIVDPDNAQGWQHQAYDNDFYLNSHQEFGPGPGTAPLGDGSLKMSLSTADNSGRVELFRTEQYDGTLVRDLRNIEYSTYSRANDGNDTAQQPTYLRLSVDNDGDGSTDNSLFFFPANNGTPVQGAWQSWDAGNGIWGIDGDQGPQGVTLEQYAVAHPDSRIVKNEDASAPAQVDGGVAFIVGGGGAEQMNAEYFIDDINIGKVDAATGSVESGQEFDLEPTPAAPVAIAATLTGDDNGAATDKLRVNAPAVAQGATVRLYTLAGGVRTLVAESTLNTLGNHRFKADDANRSRNTKYIAKVARTETTLRAWTNTLKCG